jgi:hypothetical protein
MPGIASFPVESMRAAERPVLRCLFHAGTEARKVQEAAVLIRTRFGRTIRHSLRAAKHEVERFLGLFGCVRTEWFCNLSSDAEEWLARQGVLRAGDWIVVNCDSYDQATCLKGELAKSGVCCGPDGLTFGGPELFCYRVTMRNCHTLPSLAADWSYDGRSECGRFMR